MTDPTSRPSDAPAAAIDYNCNLPGLGSPWLMTLADAVGVEPPDRYELGGVFVSTIEPPADVEPYWLHLPVPVVTVEVTRWDVVYELLCSVHPYLGGGGLRPLTEAEIRSLDQDDYFPDEDECITDVSDRCDDVWYPGDPPFAFTDDEPRAANEAHVAREYRRLYLLPPVPEYLADALAEGSLTQTTQVTTSTSSSTTSTTVAKESRRYRVVVNGYENVFDPAKPYPPNGVRFDYRMIGEFTLERTDESSPWRVTNKQVTTADVKYRSLYPADEYQVELSCVRNKCERLRELSRIGVNVRGDEVIVSWNYFSLDVHITGTRTGRSAPLNFNLSSDYFFQAINAATLPLEDAYVGPLTITTYPVGERKVSFAYGLELLP